MLEHTIDIFYHRYNPYVINDPLYPSRFISHAGDSGGGSAQSFSKGDFTEERPRWRIMREFLVGQASHSLHELTRMMNSVQGDSFTGSRG